MCVGIQQNYAEYRFLLEALKATISDLPLENYTSIYYTVHASGPVRRSPSALSPSIVSPIWGDDHDRDYMTD